VSRPIIEIENIGKAYHLGKADTAHTMFRDVLRDAIRAPLVRLRALRASTGSDDLFWALRNVSFDVRRGEVIGIIGRNGAGKSTLLKILSRITEPSEGQVTLRGRVASLLEVGTGFHPELTGRENIYLNGAILGMSKAEINRKFDEIVAFAEIEQFLDTPVKRYSSGMYVRLAFAVAAHLEPEILIIDEVLAVGDAEFQRKCLGKMREVSSGGGRTVLFVSHNMPAVSALCDRAFLLVQGHVAESGPADDVIRSYLTRHEGSSEEIRVATAKLRWRGLLNRPALDGLRNDEDVIFELGFQSGMEPITNLHIDCDLMDERDRRSVHCRSKFVRDPISVPPNTQFVVRYLLRAPRLAPGHYHLIIYAATGTTELCWIEHIDACTISAASPFFPNAVLDGVKGATVPDFAVDVVLNADGK
jgi:homopolymeric O-antigen transport system ATP-binding protein